MWTCPKCQRTFPVKIPKEHSCVKMSAETHFENRPPVLRKTYDKIIKTVCKFGPVSIQPIKGYIVIKKAGTFAAVIVKKDHLKLEFFLDHKMDVFPVEKTFNYTQKKIVHVISVAKPGDIDKQVIAWLKESWLLAK
jgi:hypothetical protein